MCAAVKQYGPLLGRLLLSIIFILSGFGKLTNFQQTASEMANHGIPLTNIALVFTILIELGGGLALLVGWRARFVAFIMFLFLIPVTLIFHNFWAADAAHVQMQMINFLKNLAIMGAMVNVMAFGPGPLSITKNDCR